MPGLIETLNQLPALLRVKSLKLTIYYTCFLQVLLFCLHPDQHSLLAMYVNFIDSLKTWSKNEDKATAVQPGQCNETSSLKKKMFFLFLFFF